MTGYTPLRELLLSDDDDAPPLWDEALTFARYRLGCSVAARIVWDSNQVGDYRYGTLAAGDQTIRVRFGMPEPSSMQLEVNVPCPSHGADCRDGWDEVEDRGSLLAVLDGDGPDVDPYCDREQ